MEKKIIIDFLTSHMKKKPQPVSSAVHHSHGPHCTESFKVKLIQQGILSAGMNQHSFPDDNRDPVIYSCWDRPYSFSMDPLLMIYVNDGSL